MNPTSALVKVAEEALRAHAAGEPEAAHLLATAETALAAGMRASTATRAVLGPLLGRLRAAARAPNDTDAVRPQ